MTWSKAPEIKVLATATMAATPSAKGHEGEVVPQIWTYEKSLAPAPTGLPYRAFVWMQGHNYSNFALPNDPDDAAARHRLGRQAAGRRADDRQARRPRRSGQAAAGAASRAALTRSGVSRPDP